MKEQRPFTSGFQAGSRSRLPAGFPADDVDHACRAAIDPAVARPVKDSAAGRAACGVGLIDWVKHGNWWASRESNTAPTDYESQ